MSSRPIFIRYDGVIINLTNVADVFPATLADGQEKTRISYISSNRRSSSDWDLQFNGHVQNELWELIKLAIERAYPIAMPLPAVLTTTEPESESRSDRPVIGRLADGTPVYEA